MKKIEYIAPEIAIVKLNVMKSILVGSGEENDGKWDED